MSNQAFEVNYYKDARNPGLLVPKWTDMRTGQVLEDEVNHNMYPVLDERTRQPVVLNQPQTFQHAPSPYRMDTSSNYDSRSVAMSMKASLGAGQVQNNDFQSAPAQPNTGFHEPAQVEPQVVNTRDNDCVIQSFKFGDHFYEILDPDKLVSKPKSRITDYFSIDKSQFSILPAYVSGKLTEILTINKSGVANMNVDDHLYIYDDAENLKLEDVLGEYKDVVKDENGQSNLIDPKAYKVTIPEHVTLDLPEVTSALPSSMMKWFAQSQYQDDDEITIFPSEIQRTFYAALSKKESEKLSEAFDLVSEDISLVKVNEFCSKLIELGNNYSGLEIFKNSFSKRFSTWLQFIFGESMFDFGLGFKDAVGDFQDIVNELNAQEKMLLNTSIATCSLFNKLVVVPVETESTKVFDFFCVYYTDVKPTIIANASDTSLTTGKLSHQLTPEVYEIARTAFISINSNKKLFVEEYHNSIKSVSTIDIVTKNQTITVCKPIDDDLAIMAVVKVLNHDEF